MPPIIHHFGDCSVDPAARELRRRGELLVVSPKVFDCIAYLLQHRARAVGRDELIAAVWGRVDVSDTLLGQTVLKARRAIGDTGDEQCMIRTVPRFGYHWVAPLRTLRPTSAEAGSVPVPVPGPTEQLAAGALPTPIQAPAAQTAAARPRRTMQALFSALAVVLVGVGVAWQFGVASRAPVPAPIAAPLLVDVPAAAGAGSAIIEPASTAVMPLEGVVDPEWAWLRLGLMDVIGAQFRSAGQRVVATDNVVAILRGRPDEADGGVAAVRRATGARYLVRPRAQRMDDGWRIELGLLDADGEHRTVEASGADAVAATRAAGAALLGLLGRRAAPDPARPDTLAEVLQRADAALLSLDFEGARRVLDGAPAALQGEPALGLRRAQAEFRSGQLARAEAITRALLDKEPGVADPVLRARVLNQYGAVVLIEGRAAEAGDAFREAVALVAARDQPAVLGQAYTGLASSLADQGLYQDAAVAFGRARVPLVLAGDTLALARVDANEGMLERLRGRPEVALPLLQRAVAYFERFGALNELFVSVAAEVEAHLLLLDPQAALAASTPRYRERDRLANASNRDYLVLHHARALAATGRSSQARKLLEELERAPPSEPPLRPSVAAALAELELEAGNTVAASQWAAEAVQSLDEEAWRLRARTWITQVRALRANGDLAAARREAGALDQWAKQHPGFAFIGDLARLAEAELDAASGRREQAMDHYARALAGAEAWGVPADLALVALSHAQALIDFGAADEAGAVAGRVLRWADRDYGIALLQARLYQALGQESARDASLARARELAGDRPVPALAEPRPAMAQELGLRG